MIRHRPFGSGHAYQASIDQRVPAHPLIGSSVNLGVAAAASVTAVHCEWDGSVLPLVRDLGPAGPVAGAEGHLASAAAGHRGRSVRWSFDSPPLPAGRAVRYRFVATDGTTTRRTRWFTVAGAHWSPTGGTLSTHGTSRIVPESVAWLTDGDRVCKVRFALRLAAAEHVVGFGERFDRLDQRGHSIDATVFEQYKGQGAAGRTYLPMPFAHVLGGTGWAFHVDTAERTWFNIDASHGQPSLNTTAQTSLDVDDNHGQPSSEAADRTPVDVDASLGQPSPEAAAPDFVHVDTNHGQPSLNTTAQTSLDVDDSHGQASSDAFGRTSVDVDGSRGLASSTVAGRTSVDVDGNHGRVSVGAAGQAFVDVDGNRGQVSVAGTGMIFVEADVVDGRLDVHFFDGSPGDNLARWLDAVGKPERLPDWVFKLWASGNEWNTQARVTAEMELHRKHDIPVGVVVIEAWSDESTFVAFRDAEYEIHDDGRPHRLAIFHLPCSTLTGVHSFVPTRPSVDRWSRSQPHPPICTIMSGDVPRVRSCGSYPTAAARWSGLQHRPAGRRRTVSVSAHHMVRRATVQVSRGRLGLFRQPFYRKSRLVLGGSPRTLYADFPNPSWRPPR
ncbi:hypothetical protein GCM10020218_038200 [Dactylosporangium vinaceum]